MAFRNSALVAEEVDKIDPDLVARDKDGRPYSVRYEAVNAMLLNEFLKEHKKVADLEATVSKLQTQGKEIAELKAALKRKTVAIGDVFAGFTPQSNIVVAASDGH